MKQMPIYERIVGLKRPLVMDDFIKISYPVGDSNFPEVTVKVFTESIYIPEIGSYIVTVWDFEREQPAILILSHTLFAAIKRWRADTMQDIISKTFTIMAKNNQGVVYHDLYCRGLLPLLTGEIIDIVDKYINDLFIIETEKAEVVDA